MTARGTPTVAPTESELAALADGSLAPERREALLGRVRRSPELLAALAEQERAVRMIGAVDVPAPASLRGQVQAMLAPRARRRAFAMPRLGLAAGAATALAAVAVAIGLAGGGTSVSGVQQAAAFTLSPATMPAPAESLVRGTQLAASVEGVAFPYWEGRLGWRSSGARDDRVDGRSVTTVFYSNAQGLRIGYAIVSGSAWATHGGAVTWRAGVPYRLLTHDGATVVAWPRDGHLCVISGKGISPGALLRLASWGGQRSPVA
jgi:hypothetical protein